MAEDDKPGKGGTAGRKRGKARRAPILDLEAKEIRDSDAGSGEQGASAKAANEDSSKDTGAGTGGAASGLKGAAARDDGVSERATVAQGGTSGSAPGSAGSRAEDDKSDKTGPGGAATAAKASSTKSDTGPKPGDAGIAAGDKSAATASATPGSSAAKPASKEQPAAAGKPPSTEKSAAPKAGTERTGTEKAGATKSVETKPVETKAGAPTSGADRSSAQPASTDKAGKPGPGPSVPGAKAEGPGAAATQERGAPERRSSGALAMFGAVLAGAFVSFAVLVGLDQSGVRFWRSSGDAQIDSKLAELEAQIGRVTERGPQDGAPLEGRVAQLEADTQRTAEAVQGLPEVIKPLSALVEENVQRLTALEEAVNELRGSAGQGTAAGDAGQSAESVRQAVAQLDSSLAGLRDEVAALAERVEGRPEGVTPEQLTALREDLGGRVDAIEERLGTPGEAAGAAAAIALSALARAVDSGEPYDTQLAAYATLAPQDEVVEALKPQAEEGIATRAQLAERFAEAAEAARREAQDSAAEGGFTDKVFARLQSVVSVRREGDETSGDPQAVIRRMEAQIAGGDLEGAVEAAGAADTALPEPVATWVEDAKARLAAERALEAANERMLAALGRLGG